jgi:2-keto-4-pentenoate hydratase
MTPSAQTFTTPLPASCSPPPAAPGDSDAVIGLKIALTSLAAQRRLSASGPVWGWLTESMRLESGDTIECLPQHRTRVEAEIVFILGEDLVGPGISSHDVIAATSAIAAGLEIPRVELSADFSTAEQYRAANAGAYRFVTGTPLLSWRELDLELLGALVEVDGYPVASGAGAAVLGHPANAIAAVANALAKRDGTELRRGYQLFTGGLTDPITLAPGMSVGATFAHLGSVTVTASSDVSRNEQEEHRP